MVAVTCLNAAEKAAVLAKPACAATAGMVLPRESCSMAHTIRARCRQAFSVMPVSSGNSLLADRTEVAARDANTETSSALRWSARARSANRRPKALFGIGKKVGASCSTVSSCSASLTISSAFPLAGSTDTASSSRARSNGVTCETNARPGNEAGAQSRIASFRQRMIQSSASVRISKR